NGIPITSCVVEAVDADGGSSKPKETKPSRGLPNQAQIALRQLQHAIKAEGIVPPLAGNGHMPARAVAVRFELWRHYCYTGGIADTPDAKLQGFKRAASTLLAKGVVYQWDIWVWLP